MSANVTVYCLQNLTDYAEFERLCNDLMSLEGYRLIEPLGGCHDKGRDALHVNRYSTTTIFAYSVCEDWRAKLAEDATKIRRHGHKCDKLVFITTSDVTATQRDEAIAFVRNEFGWELDLYPVERLRVLLETQHPEIVSRYPQIFPPQMLAFSSDTGTAKQRDLVFISAAPEDGTLARWLALRLIAEGYRVWYEGQNLLGGEVYLDRVDDTLGSKAYVFIALYSQASTGNAEFLRQLAVAHTVGRALKRDFVVPISVDGAPLDQLDRATQAMMFVRFEENWAGGLQRVVTKLESLQCPRSLAYGRMVAVSTLLEPDVLVDKPESLVSNCLVVEAIPHRVSRFESNSELADGDLKDLQVKWAHRRIGPTSFVSFWSPPAIDGRQWAEAESQEWRSVDRVFGVRTEDLVSELIKKSIVVICYQKGLQYCPDCGLQYFPWGHPRIKVMRPESESTTSINAVGQRTYWRPTGGQEYRYYLAPMFFVVRNLFDAFVVLVYIKLRFSDDTGQTLPPRTAISRRKHLCKDWWNKEWLDRLLAVCQYLAPEGKLILGDQPGRQLVVNGVPVQLTCPVGINEDALERSAFERENNLNVPRSEVGEDDDGDMSEIGGDSDR